MFCLFEVSESVSSQRQFVDNAVGKYYVDSLILADNLDMEYNQVTTHPKFFVIVTIIQDNDEFMLIMTY